MSYRKTKYKPKNEESGEWEHESIDFDSDSRESAESDEKEIDPKTIPEVVLKVSQKEFNNVMETDEEEEVNNINKDEQQNQNNYSFTKPLNYLSDSDEGLDLPDINDFNRILKKQREEKEKETNSQNIGKESQSGEFSLEEKDPEPADQADDATVSANQDTDTDVAGADAEEFSKSKDSQKEENEEVDQEDETPSENLEKPDSTNVQQENQQQQNLEDSVEEKQIDAANDSGINSELSDTSIKETPVSRKRSAADFLAPYRKRLRSSSGPIDLTGIHQVQSAAIQEETSGSMSDTQLTSKKFKGKKVDMDIGQRSKSPEVEEKNLQPLPLTQAINSISDEVDDESNSDDSDIEMTPEVQKYLRKLASKKLLKRLEKSKKN